MMQRLKLKIQKICNADNFTCYMDGTSAELVAAAAKQAIGLLSYCEDGFNLLERSS